MQLIILKSFNDTEAYIERVRTLADQHRESFGFLPASAYTELAVKDRLWVAIDKNTGNLCGFLSFGGRYPQVKIFQLFVEESVRRHRVGERLIVGLKEVSQRAGVQTISARIAADLPANKFWERMGFRLIRQEAGGKVRDRMINVRGLEIPSTSLWPTEVGHSSSVDWLNNSLPNRPTLETQSYALDLNVFFDVLRRRVDGPAATRVLTAALSNDIRVCVTAEFADELRRHSNGVDGDPVLALAVGLPTLPRVDRVVLQPIVNEIRGFFVVGTPKSGKKVDNELSDFNHLASCIHHKMTGFVTRELSILGKVDKFRQRYGLEVLSPAELFPEIDDEVDGKKGTLATIGDTELSILDLREANRPDAEEFLAKRGVPASLTAEILDPGTTHRRKKRLELRVNHQLIGIASWPLTNVVGFENHIYLIINETSKFSTAAIDHVIESALRSLPNNRLLRIDLSLSSDQAQTRDTAVRRGFVARDQSQNSLIGMSRFAYRGIVSAIGWAEFSADLDKYAGVQLAGRFPTFEEAANTGIVAKLRNGESRDISLFDFETRFAPVILGCAGRPVVMVPIQEQYASQLIETIARQRTFLPSKEAALLLERAYFMSPSARSTLQRGALVIFYVSGKGGGRKEAIGVGRITFCDVVSTEQALLTLSRQGVLEKSELESKSDSKGRLGVFTFDNFLQFDVPLPYKTLLAMGCIGGANLVTAQRLSTELSQKVFAAAFNRGA
jgi:GNAT superfamily N-acetyltransferase/predicted nucleic acid-binding protein